MSQPKAIVIGASRGIGQGLVKKLASEGYDAYGTIRSEPTDDHTFQVDLNDSDAASVKKAASNFDSLDLLIVSGALAYATTYSEISPDEHRAFYNTNVIGPLAAAQAFLPALKKGKQKTIVIISSLAGSTGFQLQNARQPADKKLPLGKGPYSATKAAVNQLGIGLYNELGSEGFSVMLIHPGVVRTDMAASFIKNLESKPDSPIKAITVEESANGIIDVVKSHIATGKSDIRLVSYDGTDMAT
ncbi:hypothetical protein CF319_g3037 [Tilletia indica]|nr:hypothetical protein CF319_g3037 [Tilletia indica]KAE8233107.1 hypothetical protein CF326_g1848 [Tilletia indica]